MEIRRAISVLNILISGFDPQTGELVSENHFVRREPVQAALRNAVRALRENSMQREEPEQENSKNKTVRRRGRGGKFYFVTEKAPEPAFIRSGLPWDAADDQLLQTLYRKRAPVRDMALELKRTPYAVFTRLEKKNLCGKEYGYPARDEKGPWTTEETETLRRMVEQGKNALEIADVLHRPFYNIRMRIDYIRLSHRMAEEAGEERHE